MNKPAKNQLVRHVQYGGLYRVDHNDAWADFGDGWSPAVVYVNSFSCECFVRKLAEFCDNFEPFEKRVPHE